IPSILKHLLDMLGGGGRGRGGETGGDLGGLILLFGPGAALLEALGGNGLDTFPVDGRDVGDGDGGGEDLEGLGGSALVDLLRGKLQGLVKVDASGGHRLAVSLS